jgi:uncharacterized protein (DUF2267 family)
MESVAALLDSIVAHGLPDRSQAERALRATVRVLGERLTDDEASALGTGLPAELSRMLDQSEYDGDFSASDFYERTRRRIRATPGRTREAIEVVLRVLGDQLDEARRDCLIRTLPPDVGRHLAPLELDAPPPYGSKSPARVLTTLAAGRPGSRHPLSESSPPAGHAQAVAKNDEPHAETKLSSAHGLTQERHGESLATGRPPEPACPVAKTSD